MTKQPRKWVSQAIVLVTILGTWLLPDVLPLDVCYPRANAQEVNQPSYRKISATGAVQRRLKSPPIVLAEHQPRVLAFTASPGGSPMVAMNESGAVYQFSLAGTSKPRVVWVVVPFDLFVGGAGLQPAISAFYQAGGKPPPRQSVPLPQSAGTVAQCRRKL